MADDEVAPVDTTADATEGETPTTDAFEDDKVQSFDRSYVEKIRKEAAEYRTKAKQYEEAFAPYSEEERQVWRDLASGLVTDAPGTAKRLQEIAAAILQEQQGEQDTTPPPSDVSEDAPLTKKQLQELLAEREKAADIDRRVADIKRTAAELGYQENTVAYRTLLITAQDKNGDLAAAHAAIEAERQATIDAYLKAKQADAEGSPTAGSNGSTPGQERKIRTFSDASNALREMLGAQS